MRDESSQLVRLSTRDVAPADRLSYASWILGSALAPSALSTGTPSEYELDVTALELPSIAIVAAERFAAHAPFVVPRKSVAPLSAISFLLWY